MAWLAGWSYRKSHIINPSVGAGANYQVTITANYGAGVDNGEDVYCNSKCKTDFGDIRFTDDDGSTLLDYWMESSVASDNAVFWVEVKDSLEAAGRTIYVYYGKDVATTSNGVDTFLFFDHFDGASLDLAYWNVTAGAEPPVTGSEVQLGEGQSDAYCYIVTDNLDGIVSGKELRIKARVIQISAGGHGTQTFGLGIGKAADAGFNSAGWYDFGGGRVYRWLDAGIDFEAKTTPAVGSYIFYFRVQSDQIVFDASGTVNINSVRLGSPTLQSNNIMLNTGWDGRVYVDWVFERKYTSPEPAHSSWGYEEPPPGFITLIKKVGPGAV